MIYYHKNHSFQKGGEGCIDGRLYQPTTTLIVPLVFFVARAYLLAK